MERHNHSQNRNTSAQRKNQQRNQQQRHWPLQSSNYKLDGPIGRGTFGIVWRAHCCDPTSVYQNKEVAIKVVDINAFEKANSSMEDIRKEIQIMSKLNHTNVMNYYVSFLSDRELWLVMPLIEAGSIENVLSWRRQNSLLNKDKDQEDGGLNDEVLIASILTQVCKGLAYFHSKGQIHRDIKAQNILMKGDGHVYLGDFGVSDSIKVGQKRNSFVGSPCWMAPEVMDQEVGYDIKADMWSLGITAIEIAEGKVPHQDLPSMKVIMMVLNSPSPSICSYYGWSPEFIAFVDDCLKKDPSKRLHSGDIFTKHKKFFSKAKGVDYINKHLLQNLPPLKDRIPKEIKAVGDEYWDRKYQKQAKKLGISIENVDDTTISKSSKLKIVWKFSEDLSEYNAHNTTLHSSNYNNRSNEQEVPRNDNILDQDNFRSHQANQQKHKFGQDRIEGISPIQIVNHQQSSSDVKTDSSMKDYTLNDDSKVINFDGALNLNNTQPLQESSKDIVQHAPQQKQLQSSPPNDVVEDIVKTLTEIRGQKVIENYNKQTSMEDIGNVLIDNNLARGTVTTSFRNILRPLDQSPHGQHDPKKTATFNPNINDSKQNEQKKRGIGMSKYCLGLKAEDVKEALNRSRMNDSNLNSGSSMSSRNANSKIAPGQNQLLLNSSQQQCESSFVGDKKGMSFYNQGAPLSARNSTQYPPTHHSNLNQVNNRPSFPRTSLKETLNNFSSTQIQKPQIPKYKHTSIQVMQAYGIPSQQNDRSRQIRLNSANKSMEQNLTSRNHHFQSTRNYTQRQVGISNPNLNFSINENRVVMEESFNSSKLNIPTQGDISMSSQGGQMSNQMPRRIETQEEIDDEEDNEIDFFDFRDDLEQQELDASMRRQVNDFDRKDQDRIQRQTGSHLKQPIDNNRLEINRQQKQSLQNNSQYQSRHQQSMDAQSIGRSFQQRKKVDRESQSPVLAELDDD